MVSRFEIDIQKGQEESFRAHVASFEGALIQKDEAKIAQEKAQEAAHYQSLADRILLRVPPELVERVSKGYRKLFEDAFSSDYTDYELRFHLNTPEDIAKAGRVLHNIFSQSDHRRRKPQYLAIVIERYGLLTGEPKSQKESLASVGYGKVSPWPGHKALSEIFLEFDNSEHPDILEVTSQQ
ncbi:MAG: hypothetical protein A3C30_00260 [Candidatus Levybacteria bacterium RIFCSPHIGHO2_02_FULL_40_18]|nr:MAG: hypothetical protein A2869_03955 [Candidatus Levybacteria bacterium RIFCSPHIGHO2_01_FULL_40_58]OGH27136.1 MAG: hypothetical protein A3C30_00260 [Candidatus Levybacteria bacterium RIFCSPHIGHO2_02_FULL_40_18]OGH30995.1 MAG: hypothetical protein A3E43_04675 [Candidatus Levybacteria bacterium RIFCSPHIGHO2_12_FULL_40_31]OGH41006.1 MAG: hypothetical protein A2894_01890 [Candidatus Levybacteria bacterium RIFCSPLOWO2_01_FULL_40_64]OGH48918.1 MAG: hypothetical protein A3I54_02665 [Candidatus Lev